MPNFFVGPAVSFPLKRPPTDDPVRSSAFQAPELTTSSPQSRRTSSWSSRVRRLIPSHRSERGGTLRSRGYWEAMEPPADDGESHRPHVASNEDSDCLVRWNTAKDIPRSDHEVEKRDSQSTRLPAATNDDEKPEHHLSERTEPSQPRKTAKQDRRRTRKQQASERGRADTAEIQLRSLSAVERRLAQTRQIIEDKKAAREQKRHLKESGDYLGVQGFNPATGQLDATTSTDSDEPRMRQETQLESEDWRNSLQEASQSEEPARNMNDVDTERLLEDEGDQFARPGNDKQRRRYPIQSVRWRRRTAQWSSAQEPQLSPVEQSQVNSASASRRQSRHTTAEGTTRPVNDRLIDFSSPPKDSTSCVDRGEQCDFDDARVDTPSSTATVIRTPNRQSLAGAAPSAWELFANGISFGNPGNLKSAQGTGFSSALADTDESGQPAVTKSSSMPSPEPVLHHSNAPLTRRMTSATQNRHSAAETWLSFLDEASTAVIDLKEKGAHLYRTSRNKRETNELAQQTSLIAPRNLGVKQIGDTLAFPTAATKVPLKVLEQDLAHPCIAHDTVTVTGSRISSQNTPKPTAKSALRRLRFPFANPKPRQENETWDQQNLKREEAFLPMPSFLSGPREIQKHRRTGTSTSCASALINIGPREAPEHTVEMPGAQQSEDMNPRNSETPMEFNDPEEWCMAPIRSTSHDWSARALEEISQKGNECIEESAYTPTITTTGCDRLGYLWNQSNTAAGEEEVIAETEAGVRRRQVSRVIYNFPSSIPPIMDKLVPMTSPFTNVSPSQKEMEHHAANDTISTSHANDAVDLQQSPLTAAEASNHVEQQPSSQDTSKLHTSMYMLEAGGHHQIGKNAPNQACKRGLVEGESFGTIWDEGETLTDIKELDMVRMAGSAEDDISQSDATIRVPGAFPVHSDVADDGPDAPEAVKSTPLVAVLDASREVCGFATWILSVYWTVVGPVLDPRSDYWKRSGKDEETLADGVAFILAAPAIVVGLAGFM
ncbi:hypothetical protein HIM_02612 [Hirsutella minnesotensis 3608]|nr:hypothetical protein HIM_02612 [Hirsutella minnesotensis 3608]